jgi:flagellar biosynthesis protein FlhF
MTDVRTFAGASMPEALAQVKKALGSDAVILGTRVLEPDGVTKAFRGKKVEITACAPGARPSAKAETPRPRKPSPNSVVPAAAAAVPTSPSPRDAFAGHVRRLADELGESVARSLIEGARRAAGNGASADALLAALRGQVCDLIPPPQGVSLAPGKARRVALIGPAGAGKTSTLAKLAANFRLRQGKRVAALSLDTHRAATHEQVRRLGELMDITVLSAQTVSRVRGVLADLPPVDLLLIDTPGIGPRDRGAFARLAALLRASKPDETHLVLPVTMSAGAQAISMALFERLGVNKVLLTRLDEVVGCGVFLNVLQKLRCGLSYATCGRRVLSDLKSPCSADLADLYFSTAAG